ncbi:Odorant receptor 080 [Nylanderia fulva]|uniref:Odorant receptor n=1 Tax=Nylanderia fulva TaxID=613905 RepID=A0A6G1LR20_9HYME|nr:Odorant receptor 080 [Nylanderia fulva]
MNNLSDLNYALILSRQCMRILGIWPDPSVSLNVFRRSKIGFMLATFIMGIYVITPQIINVIRAWGNVSRMVELFLACNFSLMAISKMAITRYHGKKLRMLITSIMTDWMTSKSNSERNTMLKLARSGRSLSFGYLIAVMGTLMLGYFLRFMIFLKTLHQPRRQLYYRFDYIQSSPYFEITWFLQIFGATYAVLGNYSVDSFISTLVLHICGQLINLRTTLNNLIDSLVNRSICSSKFRKGLTAIVIRHEYLISNAKTIDNCYSSVLFMHMLGASLQLCLVTFQVFTLLMDNLNVSPIKVFFLAFYISMVLTQLYVYCYAAERLLEESTNMAYGVYECKWYDISPKDAKDLMLIVYRSAIPLKLTAGKFGTFSLELFGIAVKTSMGYLSALLTIRE